MWKDASGWGDSPKQESSGRAGMSLRLVRGQEPSKKAAISRNEPKKDP